MTNEGTPSGLEDLWRSQSGDPPPINPGEFRSTMQSLERRIARRNLREYVAAAFVVSGFAYYMYLFPTLLVRIGCALVIAGTIYAMFELRRRASAEPPPAELALMSCIEFQRRQLQRQRDALRSVWFWYLFPLVPGMAVFLAGLFEFTLRTAHAVGRPFDLRTAMLSFGFVPVCAAAVFVVVWTLNQRAARKLESQIEELDALIRDGAKE